MELLSEFSRGYLAGAAGITVGYPFDTIKVAMQTGRRDVSFLNELSRVVKNRGPSALFDGVLSPISSYGFLIATNFTCYANLARSLEKHVAPSSEIGRSLCHGGAGFVSGGVLSVVSCPFEMVKLRLQSAAAQTEHRPAYLRSTFACAKHMLQTEGLRGFYRGSSLSANFIVLSFGSLVYFATYDVIKAALKPKGVSSALLMGSLTGVIYWLSVFGLDTIKTRVMVDLASPNKPMASFLDCFNALRRERGSLRLVFFGPGLSAALIRAVPVNAVMLGGEKMSPK